MKLNDQQIAQNILVQVDNAIGLIGPPSRRNAAKVNNLFGQVLGSLITMAVEIFGEDHIIAQLEDVVEGIRQGRAHFQEEE